MLGGGQCIPSLGSLGICWEGGRASLHQGVWIYVGSGVEQAFTGEFGYRLGVGSGVEQAFTGEFRYKLGGGRSKPSLGSLGICWEGGGATFTEFGYMLEVGRSKPLLGSLCICWERGEAILH